MRCGCQNINLICECGAIVTKHIEIQIDENVVGTGHFCEACASAKRDSFDRHRSIFEELLSQGIDRVTANQTMINMIRANRKVSAPS